MDTYKNFINGKWIESSSTRTVNNVNPANTDDVIGTNRQATREEARAAVESAAEAFEGWRRTPAPSRGKIVAKAARLMEAAKEELAATLTREEGKTIGEARGELQRSKPRPKHLKVGGERPRPHAEKSWRKPRG